MQEIERRDPAEMLPRAARPHRVREPAAFVRKTLATRSTCARRGRRFVPGARSRPRAAARYRAQMNRDGSPSDTVAAGYIWVPGTELVSRLNAQSVNGRRM